jgi:hypothetical protein
MILYTIGAYKQRFFCIMPAISHCQERESVHAEDQMKVLYKLENQVRCPENPMPTKRITPCGRQYVLYKLENQDIL